VISSDNKAGIEMRNSKEQIKSMFLAFLVMCSLVLGCKMLIQKKLWPEGYNFFYSMKNSAVIRMITDKYASLYTKSHIALPDKIIINTGYQTTRFLLDSTYEQFEPANDIAYEALKQAFSADEKSISEITSDEWYSYLTASSVYLSYDINYSSKTMAQFFDSRHTALSDFTSTISDIVIYPNDMGGIFVIFRNNRDNKYHRVYIQDFDTEQINSLIMYFKQKFDDNAAHSSAIINYSFELLFDKASETQKVVIAPMVPIFSDRISYEKIISKNPLDKAGVTSQEFSRLLDIFSINPNSMRKYTEADGTIVFVENDTILKVSPNGYLTYNSKNPNTNMTPHIANTLYDTVCRISGLMDKINDIFEANTELYISSDLTDSIYTNGIVTFDYIVNGIPVTISDDNIKNAVTVTIENGYMTEYKQMLRIYDGNSSFVKTPMYIDAINKASDTNSNSFVYINRMYVSYFDDLTIGEKSADWRLIFGEME